MDPTVSTPSGQQDIGSNDLSVSAPISPPVKNQKKRLLIYFSAILVFVLIVLTVLLFIFFRNNEQKINAVVELPIATVSLQKEDSRELELEKNIVKDLRNGITIQYMGVTPPPKDCEECSEIYGVKISNGDMENEIQMSCGGFTGSCTAAQDIFGVIIEFKDYNSEKDILTISYK